MNREQKRTRNPVSAWILRWDPGFVRDRLSDINDGILTIAGTSLGLAGAEIGRLTTFTVLAITAAVGTLSVLAVELNERFGEREADIDAVEHESAQLASDPEAELQELIDWFQSKGVSPATARQVATELSEADALDIQLELEYGIDDVPTRWASIGHSLMAAVAFLTGALLPVLLQFLLPFQIRESSTILIAALSLTITAIVLSPRGHYNVAFAVARSLALGLGTLGVSFLLGDWLM